MSSYWSLIYPVPTPTTSHRQTLEVRQAPPSRKTTLLEWIMLMKRPKQRCFHPSAVTWHILKSIQKLFGRLLVFSWEIHIILCERPFSIFSNSIHPKWESAIMTAVSPTRSHWAVQDGGNGRRPYNSCYYVNVHKCPFKIHLHPPQAPLAAHINTIVLSKAPVAECLLIQKLIGHCSVSATSNCPDLYP